MESDQQFKCHAIVSGYETLQKHSVFRLHSFIAQPTKVSLQHLNRPNGHSLISAGRLDSAIYVRATNVAAHFFSNRARAQLRQLTPHSRQPFFSTAARVRTPPT